MRLTSALLLLVQSAIHTVVLAVPDTNTSTNAKLDAFIQTQLPISLDEMLSNMGRGRRAKKVLTGIMIASPSTSSPDYFFTWVRDSALVFKTLIEKFTHEYDAALQQIIQMYIVAQATIQKSHNLAGDLTNGKGLGDAKFKVNLDPFLGNWGRPQHDGPPLRALSIIAYGNWLLENGYVVTANDVLWPLVRNDLEYITQYWNNTGYDLWEETKADSFWSSMSQVRALVMGSKFANALGHDGKRYADTVPQVMCQLQRHWDAAGSFVKANLRVKNRRTGKDINTVLSSTHNFDPTLLCDAATLQPCSDMALANHKAVVDSFRNWPLNRGAGPGQAVAVGRYREDKYFGGNPWYLATLAAGEQLHDALYVWDQRGWVEINNLSLPFFKDLLPDVEVGVYGKDKESDTYREVMRRVARYADGFMEVVAANMGRDGSMAEQFSRKNGKPVSAAHLTWSYDAFVVAAWRRARRLPPSWASGFDKSLLTNVAAECNPVTRKGTYLVPTATWFPPSQTPRVDFPTRVSPFNTEAVNAPSSSATAM